MAPELKKSVEEVELEAKQLLSKLSVQKEVLV